MLSYKDFVPFTRQFSMNSWLCFSPLTFALFTDSDASLLKISFDSVFTKHTSSSLKGFAIALKLARYLDPSSQNVFSYKSMSSWCTFLPNFLVSPYSKSFAKTGPLITHFNRASSLSRIPAALSSRLILSLFPHVLRPQLCKKTVYHF